ncbi:phosphoglycerate kinase C, glycosomal [Leishmania major strain Friedlin]|uniref:Phosphoglycerate kinase n=1 Tax=Leishmania major TaxID=5664 RepID=Q4QD34_LEIMA|nr:phosphoglycerate kinase C, glycosomal [Leishmania major strain Friedlin]CAG9573081.1 phosphoglycerate_kinase_C_-_glycosomal/PGKC [Leishmania major strain Friedlin]CAJ03528.1 phosphoglycerate kinase C, glycosomal [Leishmania major strain Friedlin]|eukprot:XP_001682764.1 phosphoglycerate kinase C, glycosomal [Leishmania major strain Friedlin]
MSLVLKKSIDDATVRDKKVLIRVDFNVPVKNGKITNDFRIRSALPTIQKVLKEGGSCILMSHLGRPKGARMSDPSPEKGVRGYEEAATLRPVAARIAELLGQKVEFAPDCLDAAAYASKLKNGDVLLLENVRFYAEEGSKKEEERDAMAKVLASYADLYVSDAFGTAHRDSATMTGIPKVLGAGYAGYLMEKEINYFSRVLNNPPRPLVAIVGGAKVSDKIELLDNMLSRINYLVIGGAMAYTFQKAQGRKIGISMCEEDKLDLAKSLLKKAQERGVQVFLPVDHVCNKEFKAADSPLVTESVDVPDGYMALDIGPRTIHMYEEVIGRCKSAIWNGPMGVFEMPCYSKGTFAVAKAMGTGTQKNGLLSIIGGGDSASAAELSGEAKNMSHVSTGGGASLELLEGKTLPGVAILTDKDVKERGASCRFAFGVGSPSREACPLRCGHIFGGASIVREIVKLVVALLIGIFIGRRMSTKLIR